MKIFCIGLSRTGTMSLCEALSILGFKTIHFSLGLFANGEIVDKKFKFTPELKLLPWQALERKRELKSINKSFDPAFLDKYEAFGDLPFPLYFKELESKFPDAKFIYTRRSEESWLKSMQWLYNDGAILWKHGYMDDEIKYAAYGTTKYDKDILIKAYRSYHDEVNNFFADKPGKLLVLDLDKEKPGFDRICDFLGIPKTNISYPKSNLSVSVSGYDRCWYQMSRMIPLFPFFSSKARMLKKKIKMALNID